MDYSILCHSARARILREIDEQERVMSLTSKERTQEIEEYNRKLINPLVAGLKNADGSPMEVINP